MNNVDRQTSTVQIPLPIANFQWYLPLSSFSLAATKIAHVFKTCKDGKQPLSVF
jgi:hypothetical protein